MRKKRKAKLERGGVKIERKRKGTVRIEENRQKGIEKGNEKREEERIEEEGRVGDNKNS